jgi:hypothetical protein
MLLIVGCDSGFRTKKPTDWFKRSFQGLVSEGRCKEDTGMPPSTVGVLLLPKKQRSIVLSFIVLGDSEGSCAHY